ncbi:MAG: hypothetical protein QXW39_06430 [Candidatus Bathyarchaeia archaeon]
METAVLISFTLRYENRSRGEISKFYRDLYGYESYSHHGRYRSRKSGYLDKIRNIRYSKGVFMIREEDRGKVVSYLRKRGATVVLWKVIPSRKEKKLLELQVT